VYIVNILSKYFYFLDFDIKFYEYNIKLKSDICNYSAFHLFTNNRTTK